MSRQRLLVLLHGAGQSPQMWQDQVTALPPGVEAVAPWLYGLRPGRSDTFDLNRAVAEIAQLVQLRGVDRAYLCGLGLGARVALQHARDHPEQTAGLVLASLPANPPWSMRLARQLALRVIPRSVYAQQNVDKRKVVQAMSEMARIERMPGLDRVAARTLLLCGTKDPAGVRAARALSGQLRASILQTVEDAGQLINLDRSDEFNAALYEFIG